MLLTDIPAKFNIPFASLAGGGLIRPVPQVPTGTPGQASLQAGFPPETFQPVAAGGTPPFGQDFNGLLNQSTAWNRFQGAGVAFPPYDATFQAACGGYPKSAIVASLVEPLLMYYCLVDNNLTNPDNGGAGWFIWSRRLIVNTTIYVNAATGNDANNGLTPATAKATLQAAVNTAWSYPPSQFTITIQIAAGTYGPGITPLYAGPNVVINGASETTVLIDGGGSGPAIAVQGPNTMLITNLRGQNSAPAGQSPIFLASAGAVLTNGSTGSVATNNAVFQAFGGTLIAGTHTFRGNSSWNFLANIGGHIQFSQGAVFTYANAVTVAATADAQDNGSIGVPTPSAPTFVNPGNVTGAKFSAVTNGVINSSGAGVNYFPGTIAGSTSTGGQYV